MGMALHNEKESESKGIDVTETTGMSTSLCDVHVRIDLLRNISFTFKYEDVIGTYSMHLLLRGSVRRRPPCLGWTHACHAIHRNRDYGM